jgi:hypothetical protein
MKKGEKVRVRLGPGEVAEAVYDGPSGIKKQHWVHVRGRLCSNVLHKQHGCSS